MHSTAYTERDGLRNREGNGGVQSAGTRTRDGRLWFPTQDGVAIVDPRAVTARRVAAPAVIERVVAGDSSVIPSGAPVSLGVDQRNLTIEYTALSLLEPKNLRFRYRLDPYDADWVDAGKRRDRVLHARSAGTLHVPRAGVVAGRGMDVVRRRAANVAGVSAVGDVDVPVRRGIAAAPCRGRRRRAVESAR